jgi:hypothetical protein
MPIDWPGQGRGHGAQKSAVWYVTKKQKKNRVKMLTRATVHQIRKKQSLGDFTVSSFTGSFRIVEVIAYHLPAIKIVKLHHGRRRRR